MIKINQKSPSVKQNLEENFSQSADILVMLNKQKENALLLLNKIRNLKYSYKCVYASQEKLAALIGCSRKTVNGMAQLLENANLIEIERRASTKTHIYHLTSLVENNERAVSIFFKNFFLFSLILISSKARSGADVTQYSFNDKQNTQINTNVETVSRFILASQLQTAPTHGSNYTPPMGCVHMAMPDAAPPEWYQPNAEVDFTIFSAWLEPAAAVAEIKKQPNKESSMYSFSQEELQELGKYPKEAVNLANRRFAYAMQNQKTIRDPFRYYVTVCDGWVKDNAAKKTPETGMKQVIRPSTGPRSIYKAPERIVPEETDYDYSLNVERKLHKMIQVDKDKHGYKTATYPSLKWKFLTPEQQQEIMAIAHPDCDCRKNVIAGLRIPGMTTDIPSNYRQVVDSSATTQVRDKTSHTSWNDKILKLDRPTETDNKTIMSTPYNQPVTNHHTFDDLVHISPPIDMMNEDLYEEVY